MMIESEDDDDDDDNRCQATEATKMATARWFKGWQVVSPTSHSLPCYVVPVRSKTSAAHVYASFSQQWYKKVRYASAYLVLSTTDQMKAVGELTQHERQTTSEVSEQDVGQRTVYDDDDGDDDGYGDDDDDDDANADDNKWYRWCKAI